MKYLKWLLKLIVLFVMLFIMISWATNPWNINQLFSNLSTGNIILISKAMLPITVLISLVIIPLVLRPLPFDVSDTNGKFFRTLYLFISFMIFNALQKAFFRQNEIVLTKAENISIVVITIILLIVLYKTFASRAWLGEGEIVLTQEVYKERKEKLNDRTKPN